MRQPDSILGAARTALAASGGQARRRHLLTFGLALASVFGPGTARAQRGVDLQIGNWAVSGSDPALYAVGIGQRLWGPLGYSLRGLAVVDPDSSERSLYGLGPEISLFRGARTLSPYAVGGIALAVQPASTPDVAAVWNAGLGLEWNPLSWLGLAVETNYLAEDRDFQGFWRLAENDRRGWVYSARVALRWGGPVSGETRRPAPGPEPYVPDSSAPPTEHGRDAALLAEQIVETALAAMGEPYRWGGTSADEGFDCSGLVWYAYTAHGVNVPRMSRDQARVGSPVAADVDALQPGDILLFTNGGEAVTHVGLYVGNARFIHSTNSGGVRVGALGVGGDANDRWWFERWVGARRVLAGAG